MAFNVGAIQERNQELNFALESRNLEIDLLKEQVNITLEAKKMGLEKKFHTRETKLIVMAASMLNYNNSYVMLWSQRT